MFFPFSYDPHSQVHTEGQSEAQDATGSLQRDCDRSCPDSGRGLPESRSNQLVNRSYHTIIGVFVVLFQVE